MISELLILSASGECILNKKCILCISFCHAMLCKHGLCCHAVSGCLCVCLSVTFVHFVKTSNCVFKIQTILVYS